MSILFLGGTNVRRESIGWLRVQSIVKNPSMNFSITLAKNEKIDHYIRIKTHKSIVLRFQVDSGVNALYSWVQVSLILCLSNETPTINLISDEPIVKTGSDECNMVLVSKVFLARVIGKCVLLKRTTVQKKHALRFLVKSGVNTLCNWV